MEFRVYFSSYDYYDSSNNILKIGTERKKITGFSKLLLELLIVNENLTMRREWLFNEMRNREVKYSEAAGDRVPVDNAISVLRSKLGVYSSYIETVYGIGYMYVGPSPVYNTNKESDNMEISSVSTKELLKLGFDRKQIAHRLLANYEDMFGDPVFDDAIAKPSDESVERWTKLIKTAPDTFRYIVNKEKEIIGSFSFCSLEKEQVQLCMEGKLNEEEITPGKIRSMLERGEHTMLLLNFSVNDEYKSNRNYSLLMEQFLKRLIDLAEDKVVFEKILFNIIREDQHVFWEKHGFEYVHDNESPGKIYQLILRPYSQTFYDYIEKNYFELHRLNKQLKTLYEQA